ncbi:MFS transporter [Angustibacter peucedani]
MPLTPYRRVLAVPGVRSITLVGALARIPHAATTVVLTVHVVQRLGLGYGAAGVVVAAWTIGMAFGAPWRGRAVDRLGLRTALLPSLLAEAVVWSAAPWLPYWVLVGAVVVGGALGLPVFTVIRLALSVMVPEEQRRTAFALDSISVEVSFMIAPALGVLVATQVSTTVALVGLGLFAVLAGAWLWVLDPPTRSAAERERAAADGGATAKPRIPVTAALVAVLGATAAATVVLSGADVSIIAALRATDQIGWTGFVAAVWAFGSLLGGVVYGAISRSLPPSWLLLGLAVLTAPVGFFSGPAALAVAMFVAGFFCAPVITATAEVVTALVPEQVRGEAMGWHGSALTAGIAVGAPLAGFAIDHVDPWAGFAVVGVVGAVLAVVGLVALPAGRRPVPTA